MAHSQIGMFSLSTLGEVTSTNDLVKRAIEQGEPEGFAVGAAVQTGGYGRQGRTWASPAGGMYVSLLLRPKVSLAQLPTLSLVAGISVRQAIVRFVCEEAADRIKIKWPNDVVFVAPALTEQAQGVAAAASPSAQSRRANEDSRTEARFAFAGPSISSTGETLADFAKPTVCPVGHILPAADTVATPFLKMSGISLESHAGGICVGIGVNVLRPQDAQSVGGKNVPVYLEEIASIPSATCSEGCVPERPSAALSIEAVRTAVLEEFSANYATWCQGGFAALHGEFEQHAALNGHHVVIDNLDGTLVARGVVGGIDHWGRLLVQSDESNDVVAVFSGEAHVRALE